MKKWIGKLFLILLAAPIFYGIIIGGLNYAGICRDPWSILSDNEKIKIILTELNSRKFVFLKGECASTDGKCKYIPYKNADEILVRNPDCCKVIIHKNFGDSNSISTFSYRLFGSYAGSVQVKYIAEYVDDKGHNKKFLFQNFVEGLVGNIANYGEPTDV